MVPVINNMVLFAEKLLRVDLEHCCKNTTEKKVNYVDGCVNYPDLNNHPTMYM